MSLIQNGVVPPKRGTPIPYICQECGEHFSEKKSFLPKPVRCPKCKSIKCITPIVKLEIPPLKRWMTI